MKSKTKTRIAGLSFTVLAVAAAAVVYVQSRTGQESPNPANPANPAGRSSAVSAASAVSNEIADPSSLTETIAATAKPSENRPRNGAEPRNAAERLAFSLSPVQRDRLLRFINEGTSRELLKIHGVGKTRAEAIETARPFETLVQLAKVNGVGEVTYASVIEFGRKLDDWEAVVAVAPPSMR